MLGPTSPGVTASDRAAFSRTAAGFSLLPEPSTSKGHQPLTLWVSSQELDRAEGHRGPLQKLTTVVMSTSLQRAESAGFMSKDVCSHLGVRDESRSCWPVRPHSLLREQTHERHARKKCDDQRLRFWAELMDLWAGKIFAEDI